MKNENNIIAEFEKQREILLKSNAPKNDIKIIHDIANSLNIGFHEVLEIIEKNKSNNTQAFFNKCSPKA